MIITRAPFRISLVGGGSDIKEFYKFHAGCVLSFTINKYVYIVSHRYFFSDQIRLKYSKTETVKDIKLIEHQILREAIANFDTLGKNVFGYEIGSFADIPSGTGMGSSSSFTVALIHNLATMFKLKFSKEEIAKYACDIEINKLNNPIGKQDQYAASYGGINIFNFYPDETVSCEKLSIPKTNHDKLQDNFILVYLNKRRSASEVLSDQSKNIKKKDKQFDIIKNMTELVKDVKKAIYSDNSLDDIGRILDEAWSMKKKLSSKITDDKINYVYKLAKENGAIGGKLLGAGGGGFLLLYCPLEKQEYLIKKLSLKVIPFNIDEEGTKLINAYYD